MENQTRSSHAQQAVGADTSNAVFQHPVLNCSGIKAEFPTSDEYFIKRLSSRLGSAATFVFPKRKDNCSDTSDDIASPATHDNIVCLQMLMLSSHVESMKRVFVISDIYSHPLVQKQDILKGHGLISFAGAPIRNAFAEVIGTVCVADTRERAWTKTEIGILKEIATRIEDHQLL